MSTKIVIVRHASHHKLISSLSSVSPLTLNGVEEAQRLGKKIQELKPEPCGDIRVYSSPAARALQTAAIILPFVDFTIDQSIDEAYMGLNSFVDEMVELSATGIFSMIVIVTHQVPAAALGVKLSIPPKDSDFFNHRLIRPCGGYVIENGKAERL